jgi:hypothetical protein
MDKKEIKKRQNEILDLIKGFTDEKLDAEYFELSKKLLTKLAHKRNVSFAKSELDVWAGGIINAIGSHNFLFDDSFEPYICEDELTDYFNLSQLTIYNNTKIIRNLLKAELEGSEFSTQYVKDNNPSDNIWDIIHESTTSELSLNDIEFTDSPLSYIGRIADRYGEDKETVKKSMEKAIKEELGDRYTEEIFNTNMNLYNSPISDNAFYNLIIDDFDEDFDELYELDEFDNEFDGLINESVGACDEFFAINYDRIFINGIKTLIYHLLTLLDRFKYNYIEDESEIDSEDFNFSFNIDLPIIYNERNDEISNALNEYVKRFDKLLKKYNKDKNRYFNEKADFNNHICLYGLTESIENETIPSIEAYLSDIEHIKEFANGMIAVDNNHDNFKELKSVLKLVLDELPNIEKYCEEYIYKLKNTKRDFDNVVKYTDTISISYDKFMGVYKDKKRSRKNNKTLKAMIDFINELDSAENTYKLDLDEYNFATKEKFKAIRLQSQTERLDFDEMQRVNKSNIKFDKNIIKNFNSLLSSLNKKSKNSKNDKVPKQLIKSLEKSINILNTFIKDHKKRFKIIEEIKESSKY